MRVSGNVEPDTVKPVPFAVAELITTDPLVAVSVTDWLADWPTYTSPNGMLAAFALRVPAVVVS